MSDEKRYERYKAWCQMLGVPAADFQTWYFEAMKIPELRIGAVTYRAQNEFSCANLIQQPQ